MSVLSSVGLFPTPWMQPARLLRPWDFPGKNTGAGCHFLLQGTSQTQGSKPRLLRLLRLLHWQAGSFLPGRRGRLQTLPNTGYGKLRGPQQSSPGGNSTGSSQHTSGSTAHFPSAESQLLLDGEMGGAGWGLLCLAFHSKRQGHPS